jgi:hypothetical protein
MARPRPGSVTTGIASRRYLKDPRHSPSIPREFYFHCVMLWTVDPATDQHTSIAYVNRHGSCPGFPQVESPSPEVQQGLWA